ncbi:cold shock protein 2-like [Brassica napus]|uniref:cold shock protein 2-like n=1 Tax=Brassica napus TaxID=3708 RepID=UPI0006AB482B|nr:cold shock protein 2-like [Brassica napus]
MRLCGETVTKKDLLEKTFSTFHSSNVLLQQQYRKKGFTTYYDLISCLLLAEANNELLMRNSEMRPPGSTPLLEAYKAIEEKKEPTKESKHVHHDKPHGYGNGYGRGGRGGWRGRGGRGNYSSHGRGKGNHYNRGSVPAMAGPSYGRGRGIRSGISKPPHSSISVCHMCGMDNHWAKNCRTPRHLCNLYQESQKGENPEAHLVHHDGENDFDHDQDDLMDYETSDCLRE